MNEFHVSLIEGVLFVSLRDPGALPQNVDTDFQVMDISAVNVIELHVPVGTVEPLDTRYLSGLHARVLDEIRAAMVILV